MTQDNTQDTMNDDKLTRLTEKINHWNLKDIKDLKNTIDELNDAINDLNNETNYPLKADQIIDFSSLPSVPIPDDIDTSYPIWSMDINGFCLVGSSLDTIEHINDIRSYYNDLNNQESITISFIVYTNPQNREEAKQYLKHNIINLLDDNNQITSYTILEIK